MEPNASKKSTFNEDKSNNDIFNKFLDARIYPSLAERYSFTIERVNDKEQQLKGIDIILTEGKRNISVDEKAQLDYLNKNIHTLAFEIEYSFNGSKRVGWLFDSEKVTQEYFYCTYIRTYPDTPLLRSSDNLFNCYIWRIDRQALIGQLTKHGLGYEQCLDIFNKEQIEGTAKIKDLKGFKLMRSGQKVEGPLNLVIATDRLKDMMGDSFKEIWNDTIANDMKALKFHTKPA